MSEITIQDIINWCDKKTEEGSELSLSWSGGGDEGWVEFLVDGIPSEEPEPEKLKDLMYQQVDYFGWVGEFHARGEATYDASTRTFIGMDSRTEDVSNEGIYTTVEGNIEISLPINIQFDSLIIITSDFFIKVKVKIANNDGFLDPQYKRIENSLENILPEQFVNPVLLSLDDTGDVLSFDHTYEIQRESFIETDGFLLYYIKTIAFFKKIKKIESKVEIDLTKILNDV